MNPTKMKAIVYTQYGPPDILQYTEVDMPAPQEGEVLVKIQASSVNYGDTALVRGSPYIARLWSGLRQPKYKILGTDIAGVVEAVRDGVTQFRPGDEVFADAGPCGFGAYAEYVSLPESALSRKPANISFAEAAAVPQAAVVALQGLRDAGRIRQGDEVLINGASGGIGTFAVQIAKSYGAVVTAVCSTKHLERVRSIGADRVIDYTREDFTQNEACYDLIFDIVADKPVSDYTRALKQAGRYVACAFNPTALFLGPVISMRSGKQVRSLYHKTNPDDLALVAELLDSGKVRPVIDRCYRLSELPNALRYFEEGHSSGKVVIIMDQENG